MKKSTCRILLGVGIVWIFLLFIVMLYNMNNFFMFLVVSLPAWTLIISAWILWNSESKETEEKSVRIKEKDKDEFMIN